MEVVMKHASFFFFVCVLFALSVEKILAGTETCPTTNSHTNTQYINSTLTLKILLVEFSDVPHRTSPSAYTKSDFENLLVSSGSYVSPVSNSPDGDLVYGSLQDYYQKMSSGNLTITGFVVNTVNNNIPNWVLLAHTKSYYHSFHYYNSPIFTDAINAAKAQGLSVDWVDNIVIIYAGTTYYKNTTLGDYGGLNPMASGTQYIMGERHADPGVYPETEIANAKFSRIGPHCHEFGHIIGITHTTGSRADIMDAGRRNGPDNRGAAPAPLNPIARWTKGWVNLTPISGDTQWDAYYSLTAPQVFLINSNANGDYFIIENRRFDQTMVIGTTTVPDYNNAAWMPIAWTQNATSTSIQEGILVWRVLGGGPSD
jgi:M6 family metalloprotease-like protein